MVSSHALVADTALTIFFEDEHNEELLARHEEEISRLKEERRIKAPILASITKYFEICDDERKLAVSLLSFSALDIDVDLSLSSRNLLRTSRD